MIVLLVALLLTQPPHETNPVRIVTGTFIKAYQTLISPSQGDVCNFTPSCSHFAKQSVEAHGIFWGSLMASDRLLRCNPWAHQSLFKHYREIKENKFHDPVQNNFILAPIEADKKRDSAAYNKR